MHVSENEKDNEKREIHSKDYETIRKLVKGNDKTYKTFNEAWRDYLTITAPTFNLIAELSLLVRSAISM
jgi:hypothetical protein